MQAKDSVVFKYNAIAGIGLGGLSGATAAEEKVLTAGNETPKEVQVQDGAPKEEAFISLLDVVEETADNEVKPKANPLTTEPLKQLPWEEKAARPTAQTESAPSTSGRSLELPWAKSSCLIRSPMVRLHNEIVEFCRFLDPAEEEKIAREQAIIRVTDLVQELFPSCELKVFGSFVTGLYLPTSDMDMVVVNSGCDDIPRALTAIGHLLVERNMAKNIQVVAKAKVPIVKFDDILTGLAFDISFDVANGPATAEFVRKMMHSLPPMFPLVMVLKMFLQQRDLNEVYQGGIGSYALLVMVAAFLLQHPSRQPTKRHTNPRLEGCLGILLLDFFRFYGRALNVEVVAVSCRKGGSFFTKRSRANYLQRDKHYYLAVEDPKDESNDLSKGSYNIMRVRQAFDFAYGQLSAPVTRDDSLLERIIRLDAVLMSRVPAKWLQTEETTARRSDSDMEIDPPDDRPRPSPRTAKVQRREERKQERRERPDRHRRDDSREGQIRKAKPPPPKRRKRERDVEFDINEWNRSGGHTCRHDRDGDGGRHKSKKSRRERSDSRTADRPTHSRFDD